MKNPSAVALGRLGGKATSEAKTLAVRKNAKLGGWPKGRKRKAPGRRNNSISLEVVPQVDVAVRGWPKGRKR